LYESPASLLWYLPFTPEWTAAVLVSGLASLAMPQLLPLALVGLCTTAVSALVSAWRAELPPPFTDVRSRLLLALLTYLGPLLRCFQRHRWRWRRLDAAELPSALLPGRAPWRLGLVGRWWSELGVEKGAVLGGVLRYLEPRGYVTTVDSGWRAVDLEVRRGLWSRAEVLGATEDHGGPRRLVAVRVRARPTPLAWLAAGVFALVAVAGVLMGGNEVAAMGSVLLGAQLALVAWENARLVDVIEHAVDLASAELGLTAVAAGDRTRS